jgi:uncharacterized damage-inducible protein DinB
MNKDDILTLYTYNRWANARILNASAQLTAEQFLTPASFSHGGLRGTLVHILYAEWIWRRRWEGHSPVAWLQAEDFPTFEALRAQWNTEEQALMQFIENVSDEALNDTIEYRRTDGGPRENILWHLMAHLVNHGTQHRSEAAAMLTDLKHSPGDIDFIVFLREMK